MRFSLRPDRVFDGYEQIEGQELARRGIRLLLCDLDYTLAPKSQREPDETVRRWIGQMRQAGVEVMILSNNRSPARVEQFCRELGITYEGHAKKPRTVGFRRAMARCGVTPKETAMLGDKLLTDMLGANRSGILALMVEPRGGAKGAGKIGGEGNFFHRKPLPNRYLSCRIYEAKFRPVSFTRGNRDVPSSIWEEYQYGNYYRR